MKTDEELKQIALDLFHGRIFSDRHCNTLEEIRSSFLILAFMDEKHAEEMKEKKVSFVYEYLSEAGPRSINGRPVFFSCRYLDEAESKKMFEYYEKMKTAVEAI